ncbi:MAG: hypothetical protein ACE5WD_09965 [Candidatus Aminicenantia bacterium]
MEKIRKIEEDFSQESTRTWSRVCGWITDHKSRRGHPAGRTVIKEKRRKKENLH